jgi:hypothetical protein
MYLLTAEIERIKKKIETDPRDPSHVKKNDRYKIKQHNGKII